MLRRIMPAALPVIAAIMLAAPGHAQQNDITVGEIALPNLNWGPQKATFTITNNADYQKIISVQTLVQFEGTYLNPSRETRSNYVFEPKVTRTINETVIIPGNYGKAKIEIGVYDVVDTLDPLMAYQRVADQPFSVTYHIPEEVAGYLREAVTFPPLVTNGRDFDTEFSHLIFLMMNQGKTPGEIASICHCDTSFVMYTLTVMRKYGYVEGGSPQYKLTFPVITLPEAEAGKALADTLSDELTALVKNNLPNFKAVMDSLVRQGVLPPNADDFLHGGSVLYYRYPTVAALFLWYDLGAKFINNGERLDVYYGTDYCNVRIPRYMYAVEGGAFYNGTNFYDQGSTASGVDITYGDSIPKVNCLVGFEHQPALVQDVHWSWSEKDAPEPFVIDTSIVDPALTGLEPGTQAFLEKARSRLAAIGGKFGHNELMRGEKFWFWNLLVSRTLVKLQEQDIVVGRGSGHFQFEEL